MSHKNEITLACLSQTASLEKGKILACSAQNMKKLILSNLDSFYKLSSLFKIITISIQRMS